jgi:hypothetical protein
VDSALVCDPPMAGANATPSTTRPAYGRIVTVAP